MVAVADDKETEEIMDTTKQGGVDGVKMWALRTINGTTYTLPDFHPDDGIALREGDKLVEVWLYDTPHQPDDTLLRECEWIEEDADSDTFKTSCGQYFTMIGGSIPDNDFHYCAFCGKRLRERGV